MEILTRKQAVGRIEKLIGEDLRSLADSFGVTVFKEGRLNKGWAGHVIEHFLGLGLSSKQAPNGDGWELKVVPLKLSKDVYVPKETMAITMIGQENIKQTDFEDSHLYQKIKKLIVCGRLFEGKDEIRSRLISVGTYDLTDENTKKIIEEDYELVRQTIINEGFGALTGKMGVLIQPRTKGPGHGSSSRAFYARTGFVRTILNL